MPYADKFLSTPSVRRATALPSESAKTQGISIHALRAEGDLRPGCSGRCYSYFYPRPPCGGRLLCTVTIARLAPDFYPRPPCGGRPLPGGIFMRYVEFLSTPSVRRATPDTRAAHAPLRISIHALRAEGDRKNPMKNPEARKFLSTPSVRRATAKAYKNDFAFASKHQKSSIIAINSAGVAKEQSKSLSICLLFQVRTSRCTSENSPFAP